MADVAHTEEDWLGNGIQLSSERGADEEDSECFVVLLGYVREFWINPYIETRLC